MWFSHRCVCVCVCSRLSMIIVQRPAPVCLCINYSWYRWYKLTASRAWNESLHRITLDCRLSRLYARCNASADYRMHDLFVRIHHRCRGGTAGTRLMSYLRRERTDISSTLPLRTATRRRFSALRECSAWSVFYDISPAAIFMTWWPPITDTRAGLIAPVNSGDRCCVTVDGHEAARRDAFSQLLRWPIN